jgi:hypothetical protein
VQTLLPALPERRRLMNRFLIVVAALLVGSLLAQTALAGVNPPGYERSSMGNLRKTEKPDPTPAPKERFHHRYSYGQPPYYRRPPTTPYYVVPRPVYPYPGGYYPYPAYRYRSYPMTPYPWGPRLHYPTPYYY